MRSQLQSNQNRSAIVTLMSALVVLSIFSTGCSSAPKDESSSTAPATDEGQATTKESILDKYTIKQLDAAANALQLISEKSNKESGKDFGQEVLGCSIPGDKAIAMLTRVKSLINNQIPQETQAYVADPGAYAQSMGFSNCGQTCSCRLFATVIEDASTSSMKPVEQRNHARFEKSLKSKAGIQTELQANACARQQTWFCDSDLYKFLQ